MSTFRIIAFGHCSSNVVWGLTAFSVSVFLSDTLRQ
jgi:hypothetical protein